MVLDATQGFAKFLRQFDGAAVAPGVAVGSPQSLGSSLSLAHARWGFLPASMRCRSVAGRMRHRLGSRVNPHWRLWQ